MICHHTKILHNYQLYSPHCPPILSVQFNDFLVNLPSCATVTIVEFFLFFKFYFIFIEVLSIGNHSPVLNILIIPVRSFILIYS